MVAFVGSFLVCLLFNVTGFPMVIDYLSKIIEKQIKTEEKESLISLSESLQKSLTVTHKNSNNAKIRP